MKSEEIRELFLDFFKKRGHTIVSSSSLIPTDDPSVLLTPAGMQQFKKYFLRERDPLADFKSQRTASIQKCFRTTDIESVGDESHLTFFEMLGNFSFGPVGNDDPFNFGHDGYFKRSAIYWAYEFIKSLGLKIDYVTVFAGEREVPFDRESFEMWQELGFPEEKILRRGREDNFWGPTGDEGPCGPTTEIYIDGFEIWNLVFNEYYQDKAGKIEKLPYAGVDTGMGFERLMKVLQKAPTVFETDLFQFTREILEKLAKNNDLRRKRIVLDHLRAGVFLIADGLYPSNLERGYILRRILRRLTLNLKFLGVDLNDLELLVKSVIDKYSKYYEELLNFNKIKEVILIEIFAFQKILDNCLKQFDKMIKGNESDEFLAEKLFVLYTSYGLPLDISRELLRDKGLTWTANAQNAFNKLFEKHKQISKG